MVNPDKSQYWIFFFSLFAPHIGRNAEEYHLSTIRRALLQDLKLQIETKTFDQEQVLRVPHLWPHFQVKNALQYATGNTISVSVKQNKFPALNSILHRPSRQDMRLLIRRSGAATAPNNMSTFAPTRPTREFSTGDPSRLGDTRIGTKINSGREIPPISVSERLLAPQVSTFRDEVKMGYIFVSVELGVEALPALLMHTRFFSSDEEYIVSIKDASLPDIDPKPSSASGRLRAAPLNTAFGYPSKFCFKILPAALKMPRQNRYHPYTRQGTAPRTLPNPSPRIPPPTLPLPKVLPPISEQPTITTYDQTLNQYPTSPYYTVHPSYIRGITGDGKPLVARSIMRGPDGTFHLQMEMVSCPGKSQPMREKLQLPSFNFPTYDAGVTMREHVTTRDMDGIKVEEVRLVRGRVGEGSQYSRSEGEYSEDTLGAERDERRDSNELDAQRRRVFRVAITMAASGSLAAAVSGLYGWLALIFELRCWSFALSAFIMLRHSPLSTLYCALFTELGAPGHDTRLFRHRICIILTPLLVKLLVAAEMRKWLSNTTSSTAS
ncbi:uncharacterized protein BDR25DRAFT_358232 [Lindgomyces ingoldianus]|uniref:Uncharacterized protein n=1 Tax=Lindgomyces ingoldianus TaxID=673940 RepID=A0ACB6QM11_9PLEO|nr:uncharacterized protein BDR25DRAFT_358232 [Lindgomyces ingoldianus]KAF2467973.1 hypothetical protein BDR25DRAFT_358232 [Lindgomyces ingoldianus]